MPLLSAEPDFGAIIEVLARHNVDFIVVGGVAATLQGVAIATFDIDIVHSREAANISRLLEALAELEAVYRFPAERQLAPNASHLTAGGHVLLRTKFGHLDVLGTIGKAHEYPELMERSDSVELGPTLRIAVLDLEMQIQVKEEVARDKDLFVLPLLRQTLIARDQPG